LAVFETSATVNCSAALAAAAQRIQRPSATVPINATFAASARLKWEPEPITAEIWTDVPEAAEIWTEVA
jgi:hypothetical protein